MYVCGYVCQCVGMWTQQAQAAQPCWLGPGSPETGQPGRPAHRQHSQKSLCISKPSPARPDMVWHMVYPNTKTMEIWDFPQNIPLSQQFGGRSAGGYFLRLNNSRAKKFSAKNNRFRGTSPFSKKNLQILSILGNHDFAKNLEAKHKHTHIKLIDETMCPSKSIDLVLDHSFCAFDGPVLWFWKTCVFLLSDDFSMAQPIQNHVKAMCG